MTLAPHLVFWDLVKKDLGNAQIPLLGLKTCKWHCDQLYDQLNDALSLI